jgi:hypothetical protein
VSSSALRASDAGEPGTPGPPRGGWSGAGETDADVRDWSDGRPCPVEVRRCSTCWPGAAANAVVGRWSQCQWERGRGRCMARGCAAPPARRARQRLAPTRGGRYVACAALVRHGLAHRPRPVGVRRCLTHRPGRAGNNHRRQCADADHGRSAPGLKPRAESASPLKGAVRRPGARVDRLGAGAVGISRLQPAWGVSPAVHGRAIEDTAARLICAACRARRVGHAESPRHRRGGRGAASPLQGVGRSSPVRHPPAAVGRYPLSRRAQALPDPPAREGRQSLGGAMGMVAGGPATRSMHATRGRPHRWRGG